MRRKYLLLAVVFITVIISLLGFWWYQTNSQKPSSTPTSSLPPTDTSSCSSNNDCALYTQDFGQDNPTNPRILCGNINFISSCPNCKIGNPGSGNAFCVCGPQQKCEAVSPKRSR